MLRFFPYPFSFLLLLIGLSACGNQATEETATVEDESAPAYTGAFADVATQLEDESVAGAKIQRDLLVLFPQVSDPSTGALNVAASQQFVNLAEAFADRFREDTLAAVPLYNAAEVALALGQPQRAADLYQRIYEQYRAFSKSPEALFMLAFTYDENLEDIERARSYYQQFIDTYPDHTFADDSEMLIRNLGKSDEEILRELEAASPQ